MCDQKILPTYSRRHSKLSKAEMDISGERSPFKCGRDVQGTRRALYGPHLERGQMMLLSIYYNGEFTHLNSAIHWVDEARMELSELHVNGPSLRFNGHLLFVTLVY